MGRDLYRIDNLQERRELAEDDGFRATQASAAMLVEAMAAIGLADVGAKLAVEEVSPSECVATAAALERVVEDTRRHVSLTADESSFLCFLERFARFNRRCAPHGGYAAAG